MRSILPVVAASLACLMLAGAAAPAGAAATRCAKQAGDTLYRAGSVRVYEAGKERRRTFACLERSRERTRLRSDAAAWTSAGGFLVAWSRTDTGGYGPASKDLIWLYDLAARKLVRQITVPYPLQFGNPVVTGGGTIAWLSSEVPSQAEVVAQEVRVARPGEPVTVADTGLTIMPTSVASSASPADPYLPYTVPGRQAYVFWQNGADARSLAVP